MRNLKRSLSILLILITLLSCCACQGVYNPAVPKGDDGEASGGADTGEYIPPQMNDDDSDDFTVTLMADGKAYRPRMDIYVQWSDGFSVYRALVDNKGVARIDGLDGDYTVTLSAVPNEYAYNPNAYVATNNDRNITVELYTINRLTGKGDDMYSCYQFRKTGVYSVKIESPEDALWFQYAPETSGTYSIESWVDITEDNINPYVDVYQGTSEWKNKLYTINSGGPVGSYTHNFVHNVQIAAENIGTGGQATYTFALKAETKNNQFPITITFAVKRNGNFELENPSAITSVAIPTYDFSKFRLSDHTYSKSEYRIVNPEYESNGILVFNEKSFKLWKASDGGDDFYHVYDTEKYAETNGYGPILYAYITEPCRFIETPLSRLDYGISASPSGRISAGGVDYRHFIEGYTQLSTLGNINNGSYYCHELCPCHVASGSNLGWACPPTCTECRDDCRRCPMALIGNEGYQSIANEDGLVPVTGELKDFLSAYAKKEQLFYDGIGSIETNDGIQAVGESGWLFACAYYEKI